MNVVEMYDKVKEVYQANKDRYSFIGLRFEDKEREVGEECEWSKHNPDREDEREFPEFGTEEYDELQELNGTSVWTMNDMDILEFYPGYGKTLDEKDVERSLVGLFQSYHCYVVAGNRMGHHDNPDDGEILIWDAKVIEIIF